MKKKDTYTQAQVDQLLALKDKEIELLRQFNATLTALVNRNYYGISYPLSNWTTTSAPMNTAYYSATATTLEAPNCTGMAPGNTWMEAPNCTGMLYSVGNANLYGGGIVLGPGCTGMLNIGTNNTAAGFLSTVSSIV